MIREIQEDEMNREKKFKIQVCVSLGASVTDISNHNRVVESGEEGAGGRGLGGGGGVCNPQKSSKTRNFFCKGKLLYYMI